jgi:hypothetical protein
VFFQVFVGDTVLTADVRDSIEECTEVWSTVRQKYKSNPAKVKIKSVKIEIRLA